MIALSLCAFVLWTANQIVYDLHVEHLYFPNFVLSINLSLDFRNIANCVLSGWVVCDLMRRSFMMSTGHRILYFLFDSDAGLVITAVFVTVFHSIPSLACRRTAKITLSFHAFGESCLLNNSTIFVSSLSVPAGMSL